MSDTTSEPPTTATEAASGDAREPGDGAIDAAAVSVPEAPELSTRGALAYSSGNFGSGAFYAFNNFILPIMLDNLGMPVIPNGLLSASHSAEGAILQPLVGAWSDRTWTRRLGRRRPFIARFLPICVLFLVLTPLAPILFHVVAENKHPHANYPHAALVLGLVALGVFLFSVTFNLMYDPYNALLADITPARQRGRVNGIFQAIGASGQAIILLTAAFLGLPFIILFALCAALLATTFIPTMLRVREPRELAGPRRTHRYTVRDYWDGLKVDRQIQLYFATQFFLWFGINAITPYLTNYARHAAHFTDTQALTLSFILLLSSAIFNVPFGNLCDRIGLKRVFLLGMILMSGAAIAGIFTTNIVLLYIILTIAGVGNAAQTASSYPLLTRLVFPDQMGLYTGLLSTVTSVASPLSVLIAGALITGIGYTAMFPFVAAMFLLSLIPLALLRMDRSRVARIERAAGQLSA
ncbi:MAG TPA: MFS transporter [Ktedonobacterales bacterium]|nr:MFS transporter [Ktedonobacterales bacterium]